MIPEAGVSFRGVGRVDEWLTECRVARWLGLSQRLRRWREGDGWLSPATTEPPDRTEWLRGGVIVSSLFWLIRTFFLWLGRQASEGLWGRGWRALAAGFAVAPQRTLASFLLSGLGVNGALLLMTGISVQSEGILVRGILMILGLSAVWFKEGALVRWWRSWWVRRLFGSRDRGEVAPPTDSKASSSSDPASFFVPILAGSLTGLLWWYSPGTTFIGILLAGLAIGLKNKGLRDNGRYLTRLFWVALGLRVGLVTLAYFWAVLTGRFYPHSALVDFQIQMPMLFDDGGYFSARAWATSQLWRGAEVWPHALFEIRQVYGASSYLYVPALFFYVFGEDALISVRLINALLGACLPLMVFGLTRDLFGTRAARLASGIMCVYPSLVVWNLDLLKDSLFVTIFFGVIWCLVRFQRKYRTGYYLASLAGTAILMSIRLNLGAIALGAALLAWIPFLWKSVICRSPTRVLLAIVLLVGVVLSPPIQREMGDWLYRLFSVQRGVTQTPGRAKYALWDRRLYIHSASAPFLEQIRPGEVVRAFALSQYHFWLEPVPWEHRTRMQRLVLPQMILWYGILLIGLAGVWRLRRDLQGLWILLMVTGLLSFIIGMVSGSVGTVFRHRDLLTPIWILLAAGGLAGRVIPSVRAASVDPAKPETS